MNKPEMKTPGKTFLDWEMGVAGVKVVNKNMAVSCLGSSDWEVRKS